jgi:hypothetical protein
MKIIKTIALCIFAVSSVGISLADDNYSSPITLQIPKSTAFYVADPPHEMGGAAIYQTHGKIYPENSQNPTIGELMSSATAGPALAFKKMVAATASLNIKNLEQVYDPKSVSKIISLMANPQVLANWISEAKRFGQGHLIAVVQVDPDSYYFYVRYPDSQGGPGLPSPVYIHRDGDKYYPAAMTMNDKMSSNVLFFLNANSSQKLIK